MKTCTESIDINSASFKRTTELFTKSANIPRITNEEKLQCEEDLTESEILKSLKNMKNGKSPGTDGLVAERSRNGIAAFGAKGA